MERLMLKIDANPASMLDFRQRLEVEATISSLPETNVHTAGFSMYLTMLTSAL